MHKYKSHIGLNLPHSLLLARGRSQLLLPSSSPAWADTPPPAHNGSLSVPLSSLFAEWADTPLPSHESSGSTSSLSSPHRRAGPSCQLLPLQHGVSAHARRTSPAAAPSRRGGRLAHRHRLIVAPTYPITPSPLPLCSTARQCHQRGQSGNPAGAIDATLPSTDFTGARKDAEASSSASKTIPSS